MQLVKVIQSTSYLWELQHYWLNAKFIERKVLPLITLVLPTSLLWNSILASERSIALKQLPLSLPQPQYVRGPCGTNGRRIWNEGLNLKVCQEELNWIASCCQHISLLWKLNILCRAVSERTEQPTCRITYSCWPCPRPPKKYVSQTRQINWQ